jgi:hypothetical protein
MPEIVLEGGRIEAIGLTPGERAKYGISALDWLDIASEHELAGRGEQAAAARAVASIAIDVAMGRTP